MLKTGFSAAINTMVNFAILRIYQSCFTRLCINPLPLIPSYFSSASSIPPITLSCHLLFTCFFPPSSCAAVISRVWPSIARFRPLIASASRAQLSSSSLSADAAIDALIALVALEGVTLRQVFADFLISRSEALNQVIRVISRRTYHQISCAVVVFSVIYVALV